MPTLIPAGYPALESEVYEALAAEEAERAANAPTLIPPPWTQVELEVDCMF